MRIKNSGKSTAFVEDILTNGKFLKATEKLPPKPEYVPDPDVRGGHILAGGFADVRTEPRGLHGEAHLILSEADIAAIRDGSYKFYLFGYVSFGDDFSILGNRKNGYCAVFNPSAGSPATQFDRCSEGAYTYSH
jgi:hypothetical protein